MIFYYMLVSFPLCPHNIYSIATYEEALSTLPSLTNLEFLSSLRNYHHKVHN